jgi:3-methylcrotonyl-CoA carboxylase beta subunit
VEPEEIESIENPIQEEYAAQSTANCATLEAWDDGIIDPVGTRNPWGMAISASLDAPIEEPGLGLLRI